MLQKLILTAMILLSFILASITAVPTESGSGGEVVYLPLVTSPPLPITQLAHLLPPNPVFEGYFGQSVDIDGNTAVVTTFPQDDKFPTGTSGTLYIYEQIAPGNWSLRGQFTSDGINEFDWYGISVAVSGTTVAVGASRDHEFGANAGAVYLYEKISGNWQRIDKITADNVAPNDDFGFDVALEGNTLVAGALFHAGGGAAYAFEKNGGSWQQVAQFTPELPDFLDFFGGTVTLHQNTLAVGMPNEGECPKDDECGAGAVYVYEKDGNGDWNTNGVKLRPQALSLASGFGSYIALKENVLSVGGGDSYVFERSGGGSWQEITTLDGDGFGDLGGSTAIMGSYIIVGQPSDNAIFLFAKDQNGDWQKVTRFTPPQAGSGDRFGSSVAATNNVFMVGMPGYDGQLTDAGTAFIFTLDP